MTYEEAVKEFKGEDLLMYLNRVNIKYSEWIGLIEYALMHDRNKMYTFLEALVKNDWKLATVYPILGDEEPTKDMIYIGSIMDGGLYVIAKDKKTKDLIKQIIRV